MSHQGVTQYHQSPCVISVFPGTMWSTVFLFKNLTATVTSANLSGKTGLSVLCSGVTSSGLRKNGPRSTLEAFQKGVTRQLVSQCTCSVAAYCKLTISQRHAVHPGVKLLELFSLEDLVFAGRRFAVYVQ